MASVTSPNPAARYFDGQGNKILSITEVKTIMVRYTDPDGKESLAQIQVFGEADYGKSGKPEDRMLGVWVIANLQQLQNQLRQAPKDIAKNIIAAMEAKGYVRDGKLVNGDSVGTVALPDVGGVFEGLEEAGEEKA